MGQLFLTIQQLVADDRYVVGQHAAERLEERGIMEWQAVAGLGRTASFCRNDRMLNPIPPSKSVKNFLTGLSSKRFGPCFVKVAWQSR